MRITSESGIALMAALVVLSNGCHDPGPEFVEVSGVVTRNGEPVGHVYLQFLPDPERGGSGPTSEAYADENGRFTLQCQPWPGDGRSRTAAVVGTHRVVVTDMKSSSGSQSSRSPPVSRIPRPFTTVTTTPLRVEITSSTREIEINLD